MHEALWVTHVLVVPSYPVGTATVHPTGQPHPTTQIFIKGGNTTGDLKTVSNLDGTENEKAEFQWKFDYCCDCFFVLRIFREKKLFIANMLSVNLLYYIKNPDV